MNNIAIEDKGFTDVNPVQCGSEKCEPGHSFGPAIRTCYLLHYCVSGCGTFECGNNRYRVQQGQAFLIRPNEVTRYYADQKNPWEYIWIGFTGRATAILNELPSPVFSAPYSIFQEMLEAQYMHGMREEFLAGKIYILLASLFSKKQNENYVEMAENFIFTNYNRDIKIAEIAKAIGIDRRYLAYLFKSKKGVSMRETLITCRMNAAAALLRQGYRVSETSVMVGYKDPFLFSKMYKKFHGCSPSKALKK